MVAPLVEVAPVDVADQTVLAGYPIAEVTPYNETDRQPEAVFLSQTESAEASRITEPRVRAATAEDVDDLVRVELSAYDEVYGEATPEKVAALRDKYAERVDLLGDWLRVLEDPERGVYGMMVCCPTYLGREDFMSGAGPGLDMTDNETIRAAYDPEGKNIYIVNLAILPNARGQGARFNLLGDALQKGTAEGVQNTYFESRIPGFERWLNKQLPDQDASRLPREVVDQYADQYWQTTRERFGQEQPIDPLLRIYADFGAKPLRLVPDAWKTDCPSQGYGVLCEFNTPDVAKDDPTVEDDRGAEGVATGIGSVSLNGEVDRGSGPTEEPQETEEAIVENEEKPVGVIGFFSRAVNWTRAHKRAMVLGSAAAGLAYSITSNNGQELLADLKENAGWIVPAYTASMTVFAAGAAAMAVAAGGRVKRMFHRSEATADMSVLQDGFMKTGFWLNTSGAIGAATVAAAGVVEVLPPAAWAALAIPAIDAYSTVITRSWLYGKVVRGHHTQALTQ